MQKLREFIKHLSVEVLNHEVYVVVTNSIKKSRYKRNKILGECDVHERVSGLFSSNGGGTSYIFLPDNVENHVKCHEAYHCVNEIMRFIGAAHENEVMAYTLSYLVDEIDTFFKQIVSRKKSKKGLTKKSGSVRVKKVQKN